MAVFSLQKTQKLQIASYSHDDDTVKEIAPSVAAAAERRAELRADIFRHEKAVYSVLAF